MLAWTRRLSRLSAWRHTANARTPRTHISLNRTYHNPSFSARPNTLSARIWYRADGVPRSIPKGVRNGLFFGDYKCSHLLGITYGHAVSVAFLAYESSSGLVKRSDENDALYMLVRMQLTDLGFSSADLSTAVGAIEYLRTLFCPLLDKERAELLSGLYDDIIAHVDSGQLSPRSVEMIHKIAKETAERVHRTILQAMSQDSNVHKAAEIAYGMRDVVHEHLLKFKMVVLDVSDAKEVKKIEDSLAAMEDRDRRGRKSDSFDVVE